MEARKVQQVGDRSFAISLPKDWVVENKLGKGSTVFVERTSNNTVIVRNAPGTKIGKSIEIDADSLSDVAEFISFCYMKNIDTIRLHSKKMPLATVKAVNSALHAIEGYDITAEDDKKIEISFLFNDINITVPKIERRLTYLLSLMIEALRDKDKTTLQETEVAVDRLYLLSKRLLFACLGNARLREENGVLHEDDLFFVKDIARKLENMADSLLRLHGTKATKADLDAVQQLVTIVDRSLLRKSEVWEHKKALAAIRPPSADSEARAQLGRIHTLCADILENVMNIEFNKRHFSEK